MNGQLDQRSKESKFLNDGNRKLVISMAHELCGLSMEFQQLNNDWPLLALCRLVISNFFVKAASTITGNAHEFEVIRIFFRDLQATRCLSFACLT